MAVGLGGGSGAGKTRVAGELVSLVEGSVALSTDAYYRDLSHIPPAARARANFDVPSALDWALLRAHLAGLRAGRPARVPRYDFVTHCRLPITRRVDPPRLLVLEGLFCLADPRVRDFLDLTVFLDAPADVCLARRIARDTAHRGRSESSVREQWERQTGPMYRLHVRPTRDWAQLVLDARASPETIVRKILRLIATISPNR